MPLAQTIATRTLGLPRDQQVQAVRSAVDAIRAYYRETLADRPAELAQSLAHADRLEAEALELVARMTPAGTDAPRAAGHEVPGGLA